MFEGIIQQSTIPRKKINWEARDVMREIKVRISICEIEGSEFLTKQKLN